MIALAVGLVALILMLGIFRDYIRQTKKMQSYRVISRLRKYERRSWR